MQKRQSGAAAVEFAFVLPLLLFIVYAIFVYGYLFVVRESIEFAAHKGVEAAIAVDSGASNADTQRQTQAVAAANCALKWLTGVCTSTIAASSRVVPQYTPCTGSGTSACPTGYGKVSVTYYVLNGGTWVFPKLIGLPFVGTIPPMPETMVATAIARVS
ncbi:TadE/TadG family type IV pilus assembly protein [Solimonas terrae]|uniref:Pilus assembly protein n=1 Tax=Solimonas terrae TaxID=1396819 RepID=A0A6M2BSF1_9GAMM|nr:TadE/TadG family type IV pilus assembly protein [Solimonas terrae]NGY05284.1 pilus assembly protein [Solimonas terrae]